MNGMAVFSDGTKADYPGFYRKAQERLSGEQRKLSRCVRGSRNYEKQKVRLARAHEKVRNQRKDFLHKLSRTLAGNFDAVSGGSGNLCVLLLPKDWIRPGPVLFCCDRGHSAASGLIWASALIWTFGLIRESSSVNCFEFQ